MHYVSDIASDPTLNWGKPVHGGGKSGKPPRYRIIGVREGVEIKVIVEHGGDGIITAYPTSNPNPLLLPNGPIGPSLPLENDEE